MHGNVWDWVEDCWNDEYNGAPTDGSPWTSSNCDFRVQRRWYLDRPASAAPVSQPRPEPLCRPLFPRWLSGRADTLGRCRGWRSGRDFPEMVVPESAKQEK
jgi:hypothetical protein